MKAIASSITKTMTLGTKMKCNDNTKAKELKIIGVVGYKGVRGRNPKAGIGDLVICSVIKGDPSIKGTVVKAVIIRQKKEFKRANGWRVAFEDNAAVLVNDEGIPQGTEIKGVVAREVVERFPKVGAVAPGVV
ncbi:MAG: 50S ribosomal protein L14 [Methanobacteriota archaeon]|nr:MAG: 50S ribosomal protein L14 [Euryarchaeota archaeon]